jgi:hypothetical protein
MKRKIANSAKYMMLPRSTTSAMPRLGTNTLFQSIASNGSSDYVERPRRDGLLIWSSVLLNYA